ncbi:MAG TPA: retropepsin-like aspartic protease [Chthoniobacterales bacterium]|nr:retropepsin-like aspartic protease [Chthoniobacterales bacterium]
MNIPRTFCIVAAALLPTLSGAAEKGSSSQPAALKTFLERQGFGGSPLQRRFGNHLFVTTVMNGQRTALMIDSGCPFTLIDRASIRKLGLGVRETKSYVSGVTGAAQRYGVSQLATLAMGNCTFTNVPVRVADESQINEYARPHLDGLFGAHEMAKFGMIVDCARQMIYVNPKGPSAAAAQKLAAFLSGRGFTRIPMRFNSEHHLEIDAAINGHPVRLIVDTGAFTTLIFAPVAAASGTSLSPQLSRRGEGIGHVQQLALGNLTISNAEVVVANVAKMVGAGLLGEEYLSWNFAIVDVGGMNLYLRPPDRR